MNFQAYKQNHELMNNALNELKPNVKTLGIINKHGRLVECVGTKFKIKKDKQDILFMEFALFNSMQQNFDQDFGQVHYNILTRKNLKVVTFPGSNNLLFFSILAPEANPQQIVPLLLHLLQTDIIIA